MNLISLALYFSSTISERRIRRTDPRFFGRRACRRVVRREYSRLTTRRQARLADGIACLYRKFHLGDEEPILR